MRNEDLLSDLSNRINLATYRNKVSTPKIGNIFLNTLLTTDSIFRVNNGSLKFVGSLCSKLLSVISIKGYPGIVNSDDIEKILMVNGSFSLVQNYRFLNNANAKEIIMSMEQFYRSQIKTPIVQLIEKISGVESTKIDNGQLILADDAQEALIDLTVNEINYGYHSMAEVLIKYIPTESKRFLISYVIIFLIASCVIIFVGVLLSRFFDFFNLAFIDRIFGAALMITLLLIPVYFLFMKMEGIAKFNFTQDVNKSFLFPYVKNYIEFILRIPVLKHLDMVGKILK